MIILYHNKIHGGKKICPECEELIEYAKNRLEKCPFGEEKPTCLNCKVHCYKSDKREQIRKIMRFSGPRMIYTHPLLALFHIWDNKIKK